MNSLKPVVVPIVTIAAILTLLMFIKSLIEENIAMTLYHISLLVIQCASLYLLMKIQE